MPSIFPPELEETILDFLADDELEGHSALKTCSLVCQAFLPICRKHIFGSIALDNCDHDGVTPSATQAHAFERLLRETPEIADYIRILDYTIPATDQSTSSSIRFEESVKRISRLKILIVRVRNRSSYRLHHWSNLNDPVRPALLHLLYLPTLTHLSLIGINSFVVSDLIPCVNLKYLDIGNYTTVADKTTFLETVPEHSSSIQLNEFTAGFGNSVVIMKLCTARPDGRLIIDFGSLSKLNVKFNYRVKALEELFRHCHALTSVKICFVDLRNVRPSLADLLRPSMQTLKHIILDILFNEGDINPLFGIPSEFEDMRTKNIIETITIGVVVSTTYTGLGDGWGRLDEVLTAPGWFSLKRVSLAIEIVGYVGYDRRGNELEVALRNLPETQFPRLSSSNSVSFDFEFIP